MALSAVARSRLRAGTIRKRQNTVLFVGNNQYGLDLWGLGNENAWTAVSCGCNRQTHTRLSLIWFTFRALLGLTDPGRDLVFFSTTSAKITSKKKRLALATDGEVHWMAPPLHLPDQTSALRIYAPHGGSKSG
jgi:diacylglycerol kinase family enzyme